MVNNYKVIIHFDGTNYSGWQYQKEGIKTVQGELLRVLKIIGKKKIVITGSSRTDAGVHSTGMTANFHLNFKIEPESLIKAMNSMLPEDIRVVKCELADRSFNARFGAKQKTYVYKIFMGDILSPFKYRYYAHIPYPLDTKLMRKALKYFKGEKDFSSFTSDEPEKKKVRTIDEIKMNVNKDEIVFTIKGKSFLRYMVRNIVGTIIDIGRGKIDLKELPDIFEAKDRRMAGQTAPARGLCLKEVVYDE